MSKKFVRFFSTKNLKILSNICSFILFKNEVIKIEKVTSQYFYNVTIAKRLGDIIELKTMNICRNDIYAGDNIYDIKLVVTDKLTDEEKEQNYIELKSSINDTENLVLPAT